MRITCRLWFVSRKEIFFKILRNEPRAQRLVVWRCHPTCTCRTPTASTETGQVRQEQVEQFIALTSLCVLCPLRMLLTNNPLRGIHIRQVAFMENSRQICDNSRSIFDLRQQFSDLFGCFDTAQDSSLLETDPFSGLSVFRC